jgi:hypothetical protein
LEIKITRGIITVQTEPDEMTTMKIELSLENYGHMVVLLHPAEQDIESQPFLEMARWTAEAYVHHLLPESPPIKRWR